MRNDLMTATAIGSAAFVLAWSGQAVAQSAPYFDWAGPYAGASLSFAGNSNATLDYPNVSSVPSGVGFVGNAPNFSGDGTQNAPWPTNIPLNNTLGFSGNWGINHQAGNLVYGFEADATLGALGHFNQHIEEASSGRVSDISVDGGINALFTFRPRAGIAVDRLLLYGTGGLAFGQAAFNTSAHLSDSGKGTAAWRGQGNAWKAGFVVGGGGEYAINEHASIKFEGLYYNLGSLAVTATGTASNTGGSPFTPVASYTGSIPLQGAIARIGLNFRLQ